MRLSARRGSQQYQATKSFVEHCSWEKVTPKFKDADRLPDPSTVGRWSSDLDGSRSWCSFLDQIRARVTGWLARSGQRGVFVQGHSDARSPLPNAPLRKIPFPHHPCLGMPAWFSYAGLRRRKSAVGEDVERLKRRTPLLDYLRQHNWTGRPAGRSEHVGFCPLHEETRPSFYVNTRKNVFYCHGCGQGGDLIRFVQLSRGLSFRQSLAWLDAKINPDGDVTAVLEQAAALYQQQLDPCPEATSYLHRRGVQDPALIRELGIGYAPGGTLRRYLTAQG